MLDYQQYKRAELWLTFKINTSTEHYSLCIQWHKWLKQNMSPNLGGKVCIVTGGSQGIGKGIALQLGESGAIVYITGRNKANLEKVAKEVKERGAQSSIPLQSM